MFKYSRIRFFIICSLFCVVFSNELYAQNAVYVRGKIVSEDKGEAIPFTSIALKKNNIGVYANEEGDFLFSDHKAFYSDSLVITSIGYRRKALLFSSLKKNAMNIITLSPATIDFDEIIVSEKRRRKPSASTIISRAISKIRENYPQKPFSYISYYRDYQKHKDEYLNFNEAIVQSLDNGFNRVYWNNKYRLLDYKKNEDFPRINLSTHYTQTTDYDKPTKVIPRAIIEDQNGNELFMLVVHDAIRNYNTRTYSFVYRFNKDFIPNHLFEKPKITYNSDIPLYEIDFTGNPGIQRDSLEITGTIYIQPHDYSIHKLDYTCSYRDRRQERHEIYHISTEYGYDENKSMQLKYLSFRNAFDTVDPQDSTYFRITESHWRAGPSAITLILNFNNPIDEVSAKQKANYDILVGSKKAKVSNVIVQGTRMFIDLKDVSAPDLKEGSAIGFENKRLSDINGRILGVKRLIHLNQYRELFVQEYNRPLLFEKDCLMDYMPVEKNCISKPQGEFNYWMNTPKGKLNDLETAIGHQD
ncbi:carboxypeptidase-like regulatory domain-containing protein [Marinilongibacter aquaticus]|uniref:carboxypeptidase-like regulatory domain-containing protein n=1 Tax=Marinilongibacter aquaticus TaxID=2975157 RepID=UPI0021BD5B2B|nr:carboxypeptidase-like regulatory domain-containing protein [Marinilongibacter aquaticus]UBM59545.1 carboxypeptidase-like regulatory domain-containing protein [Marinilongibacter aquaticus]